MKCPRSNEEMAGSNEETVRSNDKITKNWQWNGRKITIKLPKSYDEMAEK